LKTKSTKKKIFANDRLNVDVVAAAKLNNNLQLMD